MERFGALRFFVASPSSADNQVFVSYMHAEDAMQAQRVLSAGAPGGLPPLAIDFISDMDLMQSGLIPPGAAAAGPRLPPDFAATQQQPGVESPGWPAGLGAGFGAGSAGSVWSSGGGGGAGVEDHSSFLPSDLFSGGQ